MKMKLTVLWILIIIGTIFIAMHAFKPPSAPYIPPEEEDVPVVIEEIPFEFDAEEKGYSELMAEGNRNMEEGYIERAIENFSKAIKLNSRSQDPLLKLGHAQLKNNQAAQAKLTFEKALQIAPDSITANLALAQANLGLQDIDSAKNIIWSLDPENPKVKYYRGIIYILAKEFDRAQRMFEEAGDENSQRFLEAFRTFSYFKDSDPLYLNMLLAKVLAENEQYEAAIPFLFDILNRKSNYRDAWIVLGYSYLHTGKSKEAIEALSQARIFSPTHPQILFYLGLAHFTENNTKNAISYLEAADLAGYTPKEPIRIRLGDLYISEKMFEHAASTYRSILNTNTENLELFIRLVWLNIDELNNPEEALKLALKAMEHHPQNAMSHSLLGWAYTATGDYTKAENHLKTALSMHEDFDAAHLNLGWLYEKQGLFEKAKEHYKEAYMLGQGNAVGNRAAIRFNELTEMLVSQ